MDYPLGDRTQEQVAHRPHAACAHRDLVNLQVFCDAYYLVGNHAISAGGLTHFEPCSLGLRHREHSVQVEDTPSIRGMINKVSYMLKVEG